jgi:NAD(P)H-dependent FMN reductase
MPKILAFAGSFREKSYNKRVLAIAADGARRRGAQVDVVDLRDYEMPVFCPDEIEKNGFHPAALSFQELLNGYHGLLIATPEYNASVPGGMKNIFDWASRRSEKFGLNEVFNGKFAAMITASPGSFGGIRCLAHLRPILSIMGVTVLPSEIAVTFVADKFEGDSYEIKDEKTAALLAGLGNALADTLEKFHGREHIVTDTAA